MNPIIQRRYDNAVCSPEREQRERTPDDPTGYIRRHVSAMNHPRPGFEFAIAAFVVALRDYAAAHETTYGSKLAEDGVLGEEWARVLKGVRGLLNGEVGRLDCGFIDGALCNMYRLAGFEDEL